MKISSVLDIVDGRLINSPSISFIYSVKTDPKKVKEGDLFVVKNKEDIQLAIKNGAFAIVIDNDIEVLDNEIAWIKVKDIDDAITKFIRYLLSTKRLSAFYCNKVTFQLFEILKKNNVHTHITLVPKNLSDFFKYIDDLEESSTIICQDQTLLDDIYPVNFNFNTKTYDVKNLIEHSIFETTFSFKDRYFSKIKIPSLYLTEFLDVYSFLGFDANINKLKEFNNLKPIFVDKLINHTDFGKTDKFLIAQDDETLIQKEIQYLNKKYKYAKILYLTTKEMAYNPYIEYILINSLNDIKKHLKKTSFNAVYFIGVKYEDLHNQVSLQNDMPSLI